MKNILFYTFLILSIVSPLYFPATYAQLPLLEPLHGVKNILKLDENYIHNIQYSPDGKLLAVASNTGIYLYNIQTGEKTYLHIETRYYNADVSFSPDGKKLVTWSSSSVSEFWNRGRTLHLWDVGTGKHLYSLTSHTSKIQSVAFSLDGETLASGSQDTTICLWNVNTSQLIRTIYGHAGGLRSIAFSSDGLTLMSSDWDGIIHFWDVNTYNLLRTLTLQDGDVGSMYILFSPDDQTIASWRGFTIYLWDANTGKLLHMLSRSNTDTDGNFGLSYSPDGKTFVTGSEEGYRIWDVNTGSLMHILEERRRIWTGVSFSPDGQTFVSGYRDGIVVFWDANPDNHFWGVNPDNLSFILTGHTGSVYSMAFSPDGKILASGSWDKTIRIWDVGTGSLLRKITGHLGAVESVSISPDGQTLASGSRDTIIRLWDVKTGNLLRAIEGHTDRVTGVSFSPGGKTLASGSHDETVRLWDVNTGGLLRKFTPPDLRINTINYVSFNPDGQLLAGGGYDNDVFLWDVNTGNLFRDYTGYGFSGYEPAWITSLSFSPDGNTLVTGNRNGIIDFIYIHQNTGGPSNIMRHTNDVTSVSFSPDGKKLASGSYDYTIRLWEASTGNHLRTIAGHTHLVTNVLFSPDGRTLASATADGTCFLWNITSSQLPEDVNGDGVVNILDLTRVASHFGEQGQNDADINGDGIVNILDLVQVAAAFGNTASAPIVSNIDRDLALSKTSVETWLREARKVNLSGPAFQRGILNLELLLAAYTPKETTLLPNYPNPFNPETWIPYQISDSADVTLTIYTANGYVARKLALGIMPAGIYQSRSRAAYWDGRNDVGESVASGIYFYTLTAGDFTATRKMLIRK